MLKKSQNRELNTLFSAAVRLAVNPATEVAPCECGYGRLGRSAHHVVRHAQEMQIRWCYEPKFSLWLCVPYHTLAHAEEREFTGRLLARLQCVNRPKAVWLRKYLDSHDKIRCPERSFAWMRNFL